MPEAILFSQRLHTDDHHGGDVGIGPRAGHEAEEGLQILAELRVTAGVFEVYGTLDRSDALRATRLDMPSMGRMSTGLRTPTVPLARR